MLERHAGHGGQQNKLQVPRGGQLPGGRAAVPAAAGGGGCSGSRSDARAPLVRGGPGVPRKSAASPGMRAAPAPPSRWRASLAGAGRQEACARGGGEGRGGGPSPARLPPRRETAPKCAAAARGRAEPSGDRRGGRAGGGLRAPGKGPPASGAERGAGRPPSPASESGRRRPRAGGALSEQDAAALRGPGDRAPRPRSSAQPRCRPAGLGGLIPRHSAKLVGIHGARGGRGEDTLPSGTPNPDRAKPSPGPTRGLPLGARGDEAPGSVPRVLAASLRRCSRSPPPPREPPGLCTSSLSQGPALAQAACSRVCLPPRPVARNSFRLAEEGRGSLCWLLGEDARVPAPRALPRAPRHSDVGGVFASKEEDAAEVETGFRKRGAGWPFRGPFCTLLPDQDTQREHFGAVPALRGAPGHLQVQRSEERGAARGPPGKGEPAAVPGQDPRAPSRVRPRPSQGPLRGSTEAENANSAGERQLAVRSGSACTFPGSPCCVDPYAVRSRRGLGLPNVALPPAASGVREGLVTEPGSGRSPAVPRVLSTVCGPAARPVTSGVTAVPGRASIVRLQAHSRRRVRVRAGEDRGTPGWGRRRRSLSNGEGTPTPGGPAPSARWTEKAPQAERTPRAPAEPPRPAPPAASARPVPAAASAHRLPGTQTSAACAGGRGSGPWAGAPSSSRGPREGARRAGLRGGRARGHRGGHTVSGDPGRAHPGRAPPLSGISQGTVAGAPPTPQAPAAGAEEERLVNPELAHRGVWCVLLNSPPGGALGVPVSFCAPATSFEWDSASPAPQPW
uniref:collagen alpha-1(I) chain-like n=1 Tax=Nyctereutes procyonoides TaxID=34880 RepID=UPI002444D144|nr:collagen alpha-1(I) chain-like [Nyctereutes procyonoides]